MKKHKLVLILFACISLFIVFALSTPFGGGVSAAAPPDNPDSLLYGTFLGSGSNDAGNAIFTAEDGTIYIGGSTKFPGVPTTAGAFQTTFGSGGSGGGFSDGFIAIFNPDGSLAYSTLLGGNSSEGVSGVEVDEAGFVYVVGETYSQNFPTTAGAYDEIADNRSNVFVAKLDPTLSSLVYSTYVGGNGTESGVDMALDENGNVYVTGWTDSSNFPTTAGAYDTTANSVGIYAPDAFLFKLNAAGDSLIFASYLGGTGEERGQGITVDAAGNVFVSGMTRSDDFPTTVGAFDTSHGGNYDLYVAKLDSAASSLSFATYVGGVGADMGNTGNVHVDAAGVVYVSCKTGSADFPTTPDALDADYNSGPSDVCIFKLSADGSAIEYSTFVGGTGEEYTLASTVDDSGNFLVSGWTTSSDFPTTSNAFDRTYNGGSMDAFVLILNATGAGLDYSTFLGGSDIDEGGTAVSVDDAGDVFVTGRTFSSDFPISADAYDPSQNGSEDAFVTKLAISSPCTPTPHVVLFDDFNDGDIDFNPTWTPTNRAYTVVNGQLHSDGLHADSSDRYTSNYRLEESFESNDYLEFSYRGLLKSVGNPQAGRGTIVSLFGPDGGYEVNIQKGYTNGFPTNKYSISLTYTPPGYRYDLIVSSFEPAYDQYYEVRGVRRNGIFTLYVDDVEIGSAADPLNMTEFTLLRMSLVGSVVVDDVEIKIESCDVPSEPICGNPIFSDSGQALGNSRSHGIALGDLDKDGDLDAFVGNVGQYFHTGQPNRVWLNDGSGNFTDSGQEMENDTASYRVLLGDLDGDSDLDALTINFNLKPNMVWINDGSGVFTDNGDRLGNSYSLGGALGDLDGDSDLDAFVVNHYGQPNKVWVNDGSGHFTDSGQNLGSSRSGDVDLGDVDGDGDLDAFVGNTNGQANKVWLNNGSGSFTDSGQNLGNSDSHGRVWLRDLDGDGDLDAFVGNTSNLPNKTWLNDGAGLFTDSEQSLGSSNTHDVAMGDIDSDGNIDAFTANAGQPNKVWVNDGIASFTDSGLDIGNGASEGVALGDLDGDGDLDVYVANDSGPNKVWINELVPWLMADQAIVSVDEGQVANNSGQANCGSAPYGASAGSVIDHGNGSWSWSFATSDGPTESQTVTVFADDGGGGTIQTSFELIVNNVDPSVSLTGLVAADEGVLTTYNYTVNDPGDELFTLDSATCGTNGILSSSVFDSSTGAGSFNCGFPDGPVNTDVGVTISDGDGGSGGDNVLANVGNVDPVINAINNDGPIDESSNATITVAATDAAGPNDPLEYEFDCENDSTYEVGPQAGNAAQCSYDDDGSYIVGVRVTDDDSGEAIGSTTVTVNNIAPRITLNGAPNVDEGSLYTLTLGAVTDPGDDAISEYIVHWGDGNTESFFSTGDVTHTFDDGEAVRTTSVDLVDEDGTHANAGSLAITVKNVAPEVTLTGSTTANEGETLSYSYTTSDPGDETFSLDNETCGVGGILSNSSFDSVIGAGSFDCTFPDGLATTTVSIAVSDGDDGSGSDSIIVDVANVAPTIALSGPASVDEGSLYTLTLDPVTDPGNDAVTEYIVRWGDGKTDSYISSGNVMHTYEDGDASLTITVDLVDEDGMHVGAGSLAVAVNNVPPTVNSITLPMNPVNINVQSSFSVDVTFSDPAGTNDEPYTCAFDMDYGGAPFNADATFTGITGTSCSNPLNYAEPGVYTIKVMVTDKDGDSGMAKSTTFIVVYNTEGGFVTGGGWINSPVDAYKLDPSLTGRANFGFVSKYKKGASVPTGNTEFHFKAGDMNFHSSSYDWLVVNQNGVNAQYKGSGTINGEGDYKFMLWAKDLDPDEDDTFRIKIWYEGEDGEVVVYDNGFDQDIGGGNIVVHAGKK